MTVLDLRRRRIQIGRNKRPPQQRFQQRLHLRLGVNYAHRMHHLTALQASLRVGVFFARCHFPDKRQLLFVLILLNR